MTKLIIREIVIKPEHILGDDKLASDIAAMADEEVIKLQIDGRQGCWRKVTRVRYGSTENVLVPNDDETDNHWLDLQDDRGSEVNLQRL